MPIANLNVGNILMGFMYFVFLFAIVLPIIVGMWE